MSSIWPWREYRRPHWIRGSPSDPNEQWSRMSLRRLVYDRLRSLYRRLRMTFVHRMLGLRHVDPTVYVVPPARLSRDLRAGAHCFINRDCWICPGVTLGRYVMLAP